MLGFFECLLCLYECSDVVYALAVAEGVSLVVEDGLPGHCCPDYFAVFTPEPELDVVAGAAFKGLLKGLGHAISVFFVDERCGVVGHGGNFFYAVAGGALHGGICPEDPASRADPYLPAVGVVGDGAETFVGHAGD